MNTKVCYGKTFLETEDKKTTITNNKIELEYYRINKIKHHFFKENTETYGIEIVKKEYNGKNVNIEKEEVDIVSSKKYSIDSILCKLRDFQVTPVALKDVIDDMIHG